MNISPFKKSIIKESVIFVIILLVIGGVTLFASMLRDSYLQEKDKEFLATSTVLAEKSVLESKYLKLSSNTQLLDEMQRRANGPGLFLDGNAIRALLADYQSKFLFDKLGVDAGAITEINEDPKYVRPSFVATKLNVKLAINALTDEYIFQLLQGLNNDLPGFVKITSLKMTKRKISTEVITAIQKNGSFSLVESECTFDWYGMKSTKADDPFNKFKGKPPGGHAP